MNRKITIAMETAIGSGSLSLFDGDILLDEWSNDEKIVRSDRFLPILQSFLGRNKIKKNDLGLIAVSLGPGSFTGARVGLATALALSSGLRAKCVGVSVLQAVAYEERIKHKNDFEKPLVIAVLNDRGEVISQEIGSDNEDVLDTNQTNYKIESMEDFVAKVTDFSDNKSFYFEKRLSDELSDKIHFIAQSSALKETNSLWRIIDNNLSAYIGRSAITGRASDNVQLLYQ